MIPCDSITPVRGPLCQIITNYYKYAVLSFEIYLISRFTAKMSIDFTVWYKLCHEERSGSIVEYFD